MDHLVCAAGSKNNQFFSQNDKKTPFIRILRINLVAQMTWLMKCFGMTPFSIFLM